MSAELPGVTRADLQATTTQIVIVDFKPVERGTLRGFATIEMRSGIVMVDVAIGCSEGTWWAAPPGKPLIDRDGVVLKNPNGKVRYAAVIDFRDTATRRRWSQQVIEALRAVHPELFE